MPAGCWRSLAFQAGKRLGRGRVNGGAATPHFVRLATLNVNRLWSNDGRPHDGFHGLSSFLSNSHVQVACLQEGHAPAMPSLPADQPYIYDGPLSTNGRDAGFLTLGSLVDAGFWSPIPDVPDSRDFSWRLLSHGPGLAPTAVCSIYAPHVGNDGHVRVMFWSRLEASLRAIRASQANADVVIMGRH